MPLTQLPGSVVLSIIFECDTATLKHLRLACRSFSALIETYGRSIHAKVLARAYSQDLVDPFDIRWRERNHLTALFVTDCRIQKARWMAAVRLRAASCGWPPQYYNLARNDILSIWKDVVMELGIMWRLYDCATQEMCLDFGHDALHSGKYKSKITIGYRQLESLEKRILRKQMYVIENLALAHRRSLYRALGFCVRVLYEGRAFTSNLDSRARCYRDWKTQWIKWLALREGPNFIATAWRSEAVNQMHSALIERALINRDPSQMNIEIAAVRQLYEAVQQEGILRRKGPCPSPHGHQWLVASDEEVAQLEHWYAGQDLADTYWHLALGREDNVVEIIDASAARDHS